MFRLPMKLVTGYQGGSELVLAMERREIDGRCGWSWTSLMSRNKALYDAKDINVTLQIALQKHEHLPNVPLIMDLTQDPLRAAALKLFVSRQNIARPFAAPPGVPRDRIEALRKAFDATMVDREFLAEAKQLSLEVRPVPGAELQTLLGEIYASPAEVVKMAADIIREKP